jgi:RHS repeat-associated protein
VKKTSYSYDIFGNLKKVILPDQKVIEYVLDSQNRLVGKRVNGIMTRLYIYPSQTQIAAELDGAGKLINRYVSGTKANSPDYVVSNDQVIKVVSDQVGTPRAFIGAIISKVHFDEFGIKSSPSVAIVSELDSIGYAGGLLDADTGLTHFGAREYSAETGKWLSKDPIGFSGGDTNLYGYVLNDPVNAIDPSGLARCTYSISEARLVCESNDGSQTINLNAGASLTPLPEGHYDIRKAPGQTQGNWFLDPGLLSRIGYRLGISRGGFNIHLPGQASEGCISAPPRNNPGTGIQDLNSLFMNESGGNSLEVVH